MDAHRRPHILVDATLASNPKVVGLPSDAARFGWIVTLGAGRLVRPAGRFANLAQLRTLIGRYARFVPVYLERGLLERGDGLCPRCRTLDGIRPDALVIHDWSAHQVRRRHAETQREYRAVSSVKTGLETSQKDHKKITQRSHEDHAKITVSSPTPPPLGPTQNEKQDDRYVADLGRSTRGGGTGEGEEGRDPIADALLALFGGRRPTPRALSWADELANRYGAARVASAILRHANEPGRALSLAQAELERDEVLAARRAASLAAERRRAEREAVERARLAEYAAMLRRPSDPPRPLAELLPEVAARLKASS